MQPASELGVGVHIFVVHVFFLGLGLSPQEHMTWITICAICGTRESTMMERAAKNGRATSKGFPGD